MKNPPPVTANPGPRWGYHCLALLERILPGIVFRTLLKAGTFVGLLVMTRQRRYSRDYWVALTGKAPTLREQFRHFYALMQGVMLKLRAARRQYPEFVFAENAHRDAFEALCASNQQALFGTFHVGYSDMMGCMLSHFDRSISMVRLRVGNSLDTDIIASLFSGYVKFLWINDPREFIFELKIAMQNGESIGLQCDRTEFGSKMGSFSFLGENREFPTTIYHIADMFKCPVVFAFTGPLQPSGKIAAYTSPVFHPGKTRKETLARAQIHFQSVLDTLEMHLREYPELWFNFTPLNAISPNPSESNG